MRVGKLRWLLLVLFAVAAGLLTWRARRAAPMAAVAEELADDEPGSHVGGARGIGPGPALQTFHDAAVPVPPGTACEPAVELRCAEGDVYAFDSCGQRGKREQECGQHLCRAGRCQVSEPGACGDLPLEGRCDGDVVRGCLSGRPFERDCAARGKRCVTTHEGAMCRAPSPDDCERHGSLPRCEGSRLLRCVEGQVRRVDCEPRGALCGTLPGDTSPTCHVIEQRAERPDEDDPCEPCGCPPPVAPGEDDVCDGHDNDQDGLVDEDGACGAIPLIAFVVTSAGGGSSYGDQDLQAELERVNRVLESAPAGLALTAELSQVVRLARPAWRHLDDDEIADVLQDPEVVSARESFYVPVVFTDELESGDTPKVGLSTLPNGRCGGRRVSRHPEPRTGAIVVAKQRAPTTVAHELGHFLGLCHTHFAYQPDVVRAVRWQVDETRAAQVRCSVPCVRDGDGMCDTPPDPGPPACGYDQVCRVACEDGAEPDPHNVMSYYTDCRHALSERQALELRRGLALRRGFFACRTPERCACDPVAPRCPLDMTCRPYGTGFACGLDGPAGVGEPCNATNECGGGAVCSSEGTCALPCLSPGAAPSDCRCTRDVHLGLPLCL